MKSCLLATNICFSRPVLPTSIAHDEAAHDETGVVEFFNRPRGREATFRHCGYNATLSSNGGENKMWKSYAIVSALIFAVVALAHLVRLLNRWPVVIGPYQVPMNVSWVALVVSAVIAIWGFVSMGGI
jgi:hypothetical protein